jgi:hypothetical protein
MAIQVQDIIQRASITLLDEQNVRWSRNELLSWLNDGQRVIARFSPDAYIKRVSNHYIATGTLQALPADCNQLLNITSFVYKGRRRSARKVNRRVLDAMDPVWTTRTEVLDGEDFEYATNYVYDKRYPKFFYIYPGVPTGGGTFQADILYSSSPGNVAITSTILVNDMYADALLDYILYRSYLKEEEEVAIDSSKAVFYFKAFNQASGQKIQADVVSKAQGNEVDGKSN